MSFFQMFKMPSYIADVGHIRKCFVVDLYIECNLIIFVDLLDGEKINYILFYFYWFVNDHIFL